MGGPGAPDDLGQAHLTQAWLAVSDDPAATVSGAYFYHQARRAPHPAVNWRKDGRSHSRRFGLIPMT
jgi:hypothetical protein